MNGKFIAIEGPTGVGKTTLARKLSCICNATEALDPYLENPFLPDFLAASERPSEIGLKVELTFLALRIAQLRSISLILATGRNVVADWALLKQSVFATVTLNQQDAQCVSDSVQLWEGNLPSPDLLIGLSATPATLLLRIHQRGREMEKQVFSTELANLSMAFDAAYGRWLRPLLRIDTQVFDVFSDQHLSVLHERMNQLISQESPL